MLMYRILLKFNVVSGSRTTVKCRLVLHGCGFEFGFCHCINLHSGWPGVWALRCVECAYICYCICNMFVLVCVRLSVFQIGCCCCLCWRWFFFHFVQFPCSKVFSVACNFHHQTYFPLDRINFIHILCIIIMISFPRAMFTIL